MDKLKKIEYEVNTQLEDADGCECGACSFARMVKHILKSKHKERKTKEEKT